MDRTEKVLKGVTIGLDSLGQYFLWEIVDFDTTVIHSGGPYMMDVK